MQSLSELDEVCGRSGLKQSVGMVASVHAVYCVKLNFFFTSNSLKLYLYSSGNWASMALFRSGLGRGGTGV